MNIIVEIDGREAIPVRAIPLATNWTSLSPDQLARALAAPNEHSVSFRGLVAYSCEDGKVRPIPAIWWANFPCRALEALHMKLNALEAEGSLTKEEGYQHWREGSLPLLPPSAFVWRDELELRYIARYGGNDMSWLAQPYNGEDVEDEPGRTYVADAAQDARTALDFDPFIPSAELRALVMEGLTAASVAANRRDANELARAHLAATQDAAVLRALANVTLQSMSPREPTASPVDRQQTNVRSRHSNGGFPLTAIDGYGAEKIPLQTEKTAAQGEPDMPATPYHTAEVSHASSIWPLKKPKRFQAYGWPLYQLLKTAHSAGHPVPTPREVLDAFATNKPKVIEQVLHDELKYYDATGNLKSASLRAIKAAIDRMVTG